MGQVQKPNPSPFSSPGAFPWGQRVPGCLLTPLCSQPSPCEPAPWPSLYIAPGGRSSSRRRRVTAKPRPPVAFELPGIHEGVAALRSLLPKSSCPAGTPGTGSRARGQLQPSRPWQRPRVCHRSQAAAGIAAERVYQRDFLHHSHRNVSPALTWSDPRARTRSKNLSGSPPS